MTYHTHTVVSCTSMHNFTWYITRITNFKRDHLGLSGKSSRIMAMPTLGPEFVLLFLSISPQTQSRGRR